MVLSVTEYPRETGDYTRYQEAQSINHAKPM